MNTDSREVDRAAAKRRQLEKGGTDMTKTALALLAGAGMVALLQATPLRAQDAATAAEAANAPEEIIVTARRREEKLQTVPLAITAFTQKSLSENRIQTATDLQHLVPSLQVQTLSAGGASFFIRGQGSSNAGAGGLGAVVQYFNQVPFNAVGYGLYYDMENVQVLKGPQGTLFGRNTTGGAILFESKKPTNNFEGYAQVTFGDYNDKEFEAAVNVPIVQDKLLLRIAGIRQERDGYTHVLNTGADVDGIDYWGGRVSATVRPSDDIESIFVFDGYYSRNHGSSAIIAGVNAGFRLGSIPLGALGTFPLTLAKGPAFSGLSGPNAGATIGAGLQAGAFSFFPTLPGLLAQQQALGVRTIVGTDNNALNYVARYGFTNITSWDIAEDLTFKNIIGYRDDKSYYDRDYDGTPLKIFEINRPANGGETDVAQYSEEAQFQGKSLNQKLTWVAGGFLLFDHPFGGDLKQNILVTALGSPSLQLSKLSERSQAVFAQGTYDLSDLVEGLKFTGGYRYTWDYRSIATQTFKSLAPGGTCGLTPPPNASCTAAAGGYFHGSSWTIGMDYQLAPNVLVYAEGRRGYKSGGLNQQTTDPATLVFKPESVTDVEIGAKADWELMGIKGRTNIDAYHQDYTNIQLNVTVIQNGLPATVTKNAAVATVEGVELEGAIYPLKGLEISGNYSYGHPHYDQFTAGLQPTAILYNGLPQNQYSVTARYHLPVSEELGDISVSGTYSWRSHEIITTTPDPFQSQGNYGLLNFNVAWNGIMGQPLDLSLFVTNATDQVYALGNFSLYNSIGFSSLVYGEPRMWGAQMRYHF
jgi:iron complex outermembrane receptor protein